MKRVLITGANSYIGCSVERYLGRWQDQYQVDTVDMRDSWREKSFRGYDAVLHVAGIVHQPGSKADPAQAELYDRVNHRLAVDTARKAKAEGVGQFLFMSSESVYGLTAPLGGTVTITADTPLSPADNYGRSKRDAEQELLALADDGFRLAILRPPIIYGHGCKGNYQTLSRLAKRLPIFPWVDNRRSMLYIENFAELVRLLIDDRAEGIFCPQDREYVNTSDLVGLIAHLSGRNMMMVRGFTWALRLLRPVTGMVDKAFGSLCYDMALSDYPRDYRVKDFITSVRETEGV